MAESRIPLTQEYLKTCLDYDPKTGVFTWKSRPEIHPSWDRKYAGKPAGYRQSSGYIRIRIDNKAYLSSRLAWLFMTGKWPVELIDHVNLNRDDDRFDNLREANKNQNGSNRRKLATNTSGFKGVSLHRETNKWLAQTTFNKKSIYIGLFSSPQEAHAAYAAMVKKLNGQFSRTE